MDKVYDIINELVEISLWIEGYLEEQDRVHKGFENSHNE